MLAENNPFPSLLVVEGTTPTSPAAGDQRLFVDSADHKLKRVNSSGAVTTIEGGGTGTTFSGAKVYASTNPSVPSAAWTLITWDSEDFDTDSYHDPATNPGRFTIATTGYYRVGYNLATAVDLAASSRYLGAVFLNGNPGVGTKVRGSQYEADLNYTSTTGAYPAVSVDTPVHLTAGDYVTCGLYQSSGATKTLDAAACAFWLTKLG